MSTGVSRLTRRHAIIGAGGVAVAAAAIWASIRREGATPHSASEAPASNPQEKPGGGALLARVADIVLPETPDGPAASALDVHEFVLLALAHGLEGTLEAEAPYAPADNDYVAWLAKSLDAMTDGDFNIANPEAQTAAVAAIDAAAFADRALPTPWIKIKSLILIGYYTSEVGGSEVLRFNTIPGEYLGKVKKEPGMKALSNDWSAVKYG